MIADKKKIIKVDVFSFIKGLLVSSDDFNIINSMTNDDLSVSVMIKSSDIVLVDKGTPVEVVFYYINGDRVKYDTVVDVCTEFQLNVTIGTENTLLEERRRYYKLNTDLNASIALETSDGKDIVFEQPVFSKIKNINIGGVFIECRYNFMINDIIVLSFKILGKELDIPAKILRIQKKEKTVEGYGCEFVKLTMTEEEIIARYINTVQRDSLDSIKKKISSR